MLNFYLWCSLYVVAVIWSLMGLILAYEDVIQDRMVYYKRSRWRNYYRRPWRSFFTNLAPPAVAFLVCTFSLAMGETYRADQDLTLLERIGGMIVSFWFFVRFAQSYYMCAATSHARRHAT